MFHSVEQENRIYLEQGIMRSGEPGTASLCKHKNLSCIRCCLPHIGGDSHVADSGGYLGPGNTLMKFRNYNPLMDPRIEASQYEDCFSDVGREEMDRRFSERRALFLKIYDPRNPTQTLRMYMAAAQVREGYRYRHAAYAGPASLYIGGSVPKKKVPQGELPECQLSGFVDANGTVGCMAHPLAESSGGYDGRDEAGYFHHTGCCKSIGCEASKEFLFLSPSAMKVFDAAIDGMSWYQYSRHATSVLVYYLRSYDYILARLDRGRGLDSLRLEEIVRFTNTLYDNWPLRRQGNEPGFMDSLAILSTGIPLAERIMYIALDTAFSANNFEAQLQQARDYIAGSLPVPVRDCGAGSPEP